MASTEPELLPAAATGANDSIRDAPVLPNVATQEYESTQPITGPSASMGTEEGNPPLTSGPPTKSLFGPYPETTDTSDDDPHPTVSSSARHTPVSSPSDEIESSKENRQEVNQPPLILNPQGREPSSPEHINNPSTLNKSPLPPLTREKTAPAIGPATDKPTLVPKQSEIQGPALFITLLLSSTGARHPYKLDEKYLRKRNVAVDGNNPINISLYKLKELILRDWRDGEINPFVTEPCSRSTAFNLLTVFW